MSEAISLLKDLQELQSTGNNNTTVYNDDEKPVGYWNGGNVNDLMRVIKDVQNSRAGPIDLENLQDRYCPEELKDLSCCNVIACDQMGQCMIGDSEDELKVVKVEEI